MPLNPDKCANAVESTMKRFKVKGRMTTFGIGKQSGNVFVGIDTKPSNSDMMFVCTQVANSLGGKIAAIKHKGQHGFLFYAASGSGPSMTDLPTKTTPRLPSPKTPKSPKSGTTKGSDGDYWKGFKKTR